MDIAKVSNMLEVQHSDEASKELMQGKIQSNNLTSIHAEWAGFGVFSAASRIPHSLSAAVQGPLRQKILHLLSI